jgi:hypothetical protein
VYVDADSPRQAKLKAQGLIWRSQSIDVALEDLEAVATNDEAGRPEVTWNIINGLGEPAGTVNARTSDEALHVYGSVNNVDTRYYRATPAEQPTTSRAVFDSLSNVWQDWLQNIGITDMITLHGTLGNVEHGNNNAVRNLDVNQKAFITNTINQEIQRRAGIVAANADNAENAVRASLPDAHYDWLENIATHSDINLINVLNHENTPTVLNDQQIAYFRVAIKHELRRRGINPDDAPAVPNYEIYAPATGVVVHQFHADNETDANRKFSEFEQNYESDYDFHHEFRRIGPAHPAQQELPLEPTVPQTTATDFEVVKADGSIVSRIQGADMVYAHRKARELEQDLGLESGALTVRALAAQTNESIKQLRRLAGLK